MNYKYFALALVFVLGLMVAESLGQCFAQPAFQQQVFAQPVVQQPFFGQPVFAQQPIVYQTRFLSAAPQFASPVVVANPFASVAVNRGRVRVVAPRTVVNVNRGLFRRSVVVRAPGTFVRIR